MDWQDELRTLDANLSDGTISQAEYRKLRDQVLAEASSGGPVHRPLAPAAAAAGHPVRIPESAAAEEPSGEMTQVISAENTPDTQDTTGTAEEAIDADRTVVVGAGQANGSYQPPARAVAPPLPWEVELPHAAHIPVQGTEVFSAARNERSGARVVLGALAAVVVVALVVGGVWWFFLREDPATPPATGQTTAAGVPTNTNPDDRIPALPGVANANDGTMSTDRAVQLKIIAPAESTLLHQHGIGQLVFRGSTGDTTGYSLIAVRGPAGQTAKITEITDALRAYLHQNGFRDAAALAGGYPVQVAHYGDVAVYRTVYTSGGYSVRVGVSRKGGATDAALRKDLTDVLGKVAPALPRG